VNIFANPESTLSKRDFSSEEQLLWGKDQWRKQGTPVFQIIVKSST
jgi:hypothetical protein